MSIEELEKRVASLETFAAVRHEQDLRVEQRFNSVDKSLIRMESNVEKSLTRIEKDVEDTKRTVSKAAWIIIGTVFTAAVGAYFSIGSLP